MELKKSTKEAHSMFRQMPQDFYDGDEDEDDEYVGMDPKRGKLSSDGSKGSNNMRLLRDLGKKVQLICFSPLILQMLSRLERTKGGKKQSMSYVGKS